MRSNAIVYTLVYTPSRTQRFISTVTAVPHPQKTAPLGYTGGAAPNPSRPL
jgi:hypothetical protein